jgi:hypothetical protein
VLLKEITSVDQPGDPIGKGWHWVLIEELPNPVPGQDETLSPISSQYVDNKIVRSRSVQEIDITRASVNAERDRRLENKYAVTLPGPIVVQVHMNKQSLVNLHELATMARLLIAKGDSRTTTYRDADNVNHSLTPTQLTEVFLAVNLQVQSIWEASWLIKDDTDLPTNLKMLKRDMRWPL